ncbi:MAG: hypothetical protein WB441_03910 [Nocardioidaceae bacterium]
MTEMRLTRGLLGATGIGLVLVGLQNLLGASLPDLVNIGLWLAGGVVLHDAVIAPGVVAVAVVVLPRLPSWSRAPAVAGLVVLLTVTLVALPVIGRFGAREDVPSLLNRPYGALWLGFAALVVAVVVIASLVRRRCSPTGS